MAGRPLVLDDGLKPHREKLVIVQRGPTVWNVEGDRGDIYPEGVFASEGAARAFRRGYRLWRRGCGPRPSRQ